jgi:RNA polymerase sigma-70 factor (sigma-E family)
MKAELEEQFREFARTQSGPLRRFGYLLCADWHLAEDLVQSTLVKMYRAWPRIQRRETVGQYARQTLLRCWLDEKRRPWRRSERRDGAVPDVADPAVDLGSHSDRAVDRERVLRAMTEVPPRQRAVLVLRFWEELSLAETAATLRCSEGNVKSQQSRGLAKLRSVLDRLEATPELRRRVS